MEFLKIAQLKIKNLNFPNGQQGMTYVELIVVLSIFSIMSAVVLFNYGGFQAKVDVKNLGSDIALHIVEAQKSALSGALPPLVVAGTWRPSYGVHFRASDQKSFIYFADLDNNKLWEGLDCSGECRKKVTIAKQETISALRVYYTGNPAPAVLSDLTITFSRPDSGATMRSSSGFSGTISYVEIVVTSPKGPQSLIKLYPSGRIEVK